MHVSSFFTALSALHSKTVFPMTLKRRQKLQCAQSRFDPTTSLKLVNIFDSAVYLNLFIPFSVVLLSWLSWRQMETQRPWTLPLEIMWGFFQRILKSWWMVFWSTSQMPLQSTRVFTWSPFQTLAMVTITNGSYNKLYTILVGKCFCWAPKFKLIFYGSFPWCLSEEKRWLTDDRIPACTLVQALTYFLDVTTPPSQSLLRKLSTVAGQEEDRKRLEALASVIALHSSFLRI